MINYTQQCLFIMYVVIKKNVLVMFLVFVDLTINTKEVKKKLPKIEPTSNVLFAVCRDTALNIRTNLSQKTLLLL